jgi:hypothetical protein
MSKSSKRSKRSRRVPADRSATVDVVTQLGIAIRNPHAALIGAVLGGLVPWFGRTLAHGEIQQAWSNNRTLALVMVAVVVGCGAFSGLSVYKFGRAAFADPRKALGFVLALEGVMLVSHGVTSGVALAALILINAVANGSVIALAREATRRKQEADARGAATRAQRRAGARNGAQGGGSQEAPIVAESPATAPLRTPATVQQGPGIGGSASYSVALQGRPSWGPGNEPPRVHVVPVRGRRATLGDVIDAEIVAEKFLV